MIAEFQGEYRWLSNFWPCHIRMRGIVYPSVENAYQAAKTDDLQLRVAFERCSAAEAKRLGKLLVLRDGWDAMKLQVMYELVRMKFSRVFNTELAVKLAATGTEELQEGNRWHDTFWGVYLPTGVGRNELGKIIMRVRAKL